MDIIDISDDLANISRVWKRFKQNIETKQKVYINMPQDEYFSWVLAACTKKIELNIIVCRDHVWVSRIEGDLLSNGLVDVVALPSPWSQMSREEMSILSKKIDAILKKNSGYFIIAAEDISSGWEYKWLNGLSVCAKSNYRFSDLSSSLVEAGYLRVTKVMEQGEFSVIGDMWQIWGIGEEKPYLLYFENNLLDKIELEKKKLPDAKLRGQLVRTGERKNILDWILKLEIARVVYFGLEEDIKEVLPGKKIWVNCLNKNQKDTLFLPMSGFGWVFGGRDNFINAINKKQPTKNLIISEHGSEVKKWVNEDSFDNRDFKFFLSKMAIGGWLDEEKILIWTDRELFRVRQNDFVVKTKSKKSINWQKLVQFHVGDLVVHSDHGIGLLKDFVTKDIAGVVKDYFVVSYAKGDLLYVPIEQLNKLAKYVGSKLIKLNRLGSVVWGKRKRKAFKQVEKMAKELLRLYAKRKLIRRKPYFVPDDMIEKLDVGFGYELTIDQQDALKDINEDLERNFPMDRLLCGDVGFGKTEIAIRAAAKVAISGKQVAVLVPTTVLAEQHFITFLERLNELKIRVDVLSRMRDKDYQKNVLSGIENGKIQVLIGTHRLLQRDVIFKDLGLIVIDEEQKFGVRAKEQLKKLRYEIDVLSMSATPIPRTLNMSMGGVRDLSILETPPLGRRSVETNVMPYSSQVVLNAVEREVVRGGQVFVVHNRVRTIDSVVSELVNILGEKIKIGVAHGQMSEKQLAMAMNKFAKNEYNVLVATTIVENGLDLPNVNTLIVENATGLGLSQLYQLRGRVGRSSKKAYAYFFYRSEKLKDKAKQRLDALASAKELGSGLKLAIADMEIRGVGNILGIQQHGNAYAVGLGMFLDMLGEMVEKLKENQNFEDIMQEKEVIIDLPVSFSIPRYYIEKMEERILLEQKISAQIDLKSVDEIAKKVIERHGPLPDECSNLFKIVKIRILAERMHIRQLVTRTQTLVNGARENNLFITFDDEISLDWVQYLFNLDSNWVFRNNEARIDLNKISKNIIDWLLDILGKKNQAGI